jgi:iron complex transport system substrate-binding protein
MKHTHVFLLVLAVLLAVTPTFAQDVDPCVTDYDPDVDYFADKIEITDAENFSVEYFNNYKVVTVQGSMAIYDYVLVQCGTPAPEADDFPEGTQFVDVPAGDIISLSTTFLPGIAGLGLADYVVGLDSVLYTNTPEIVERIEAGEIIAAAPAFELNLELVLEAEPSLVMSDDFDPDRFNQLTEAGVVTAINTDYLEGTPLGRAEWLKFTSLFYNAEAEAEALYDEIVTAYEEVAGLASEVPDDERPSVLWNAPFNGDWGIPGGETYAGRLLDAAGADIVLSEPDDAGVQIYSLEAVYEAGLDADIWIANLFAVDSLDALVALDERYADFAAVQNGNIWNNDLFVNENGGNNYYELGVTNPHLVLQDLVAVFHPDLLPDHEFLFLRPLE